MKYFAYGSNMLLERLHQRVKSAKNPMRATLPGYALRFHKVSSDESGKCNVVGPGIEGASVEGVVFDVREDEIPVLDKAEGLGHGYRKDSMNLTVNGELHDALIYIAEENAIDDTLSPYRWYHDLVLAGAEQNRLPAEYVAGVREVVAVEDPKSNRKTRREALAALAAYHENALRAE
jgi:hypothetical protein